MPSRPTILVLESSREEGASRAERLRGLGFLPVLAKTPDQARTILADPRFNIEAAVLPADLPVMDYGAAVRDLRAQSLTGRLECLVVGEPPDEYGTERLRDAGIQLVLWEPYADAALRFQANRALDGARQQEVREYRRVPIACRVRILSGRFVKAAKLYTLSIGGAFVETPRPALRGSSVRLELVLAQRDISIEGEVVYTNVPGNLRRENLPVGMSVRFTRMAPDATQAIKRALLDAARTIELEPLEGAARESWIRRMWGGLAKSG